MKYDYYILKMIGCVEPVLVGPFSTEKEMLERREEYGEDPSETENTFACLKITKGAEIEEL